MLKPETLCFHCDNFDCRWRKCLKAVPGWIACPTQIKSGKNYTPSYIVMQCPEFKRGSGYENDKEWKSLQKHPKRTMYHALAGIFALCKDADYLTESEVRTLILEAQERHEADIASHEARYKDLQEKCIRLLKELEELKNGGTDDAD